MTAKEYMKLAGYETEGDFFTDILFHMEAYGKVKASETLKEKLEQQRKNCYEGLMDTQRAKELPTPDQLRDSILHAEEPK
jgi:DNA-directed RNA polymerase subunit L